MNICQTKWFKNISVVPFVSGEVKKKKTKLKKIQLNKSNTLAPLNIILINNRNN